MSTERQDWQAGHRDYDDPGSSTRPTGPYGCSTCAAATGFETVDDLRPEREPWRLGVGRLRERSEGPLPERLFAFVR